MEDSTEFEDQLVDVIVRCPVTDKFFPTGITAVPESFISSQLEGNSSRCPLCGQTHRWGDSEVALDN
ncbi:hypothetical protein [Paenarthrobacter sp.]|uniref:hypothetical protein n=1 Tax=Paenarthrobacter sp. TaxID=1931993 RepID=UPI002811448B|nr:hypothetical protein [Paenarthrobacter sp.]